MSEAVLDTERPVVEIIGPWLRNHGDVLNLWSVIDWLGPVADLAASSDLGLDALPRELPLRRVRWGIDRPAAGQAVRSCSPRAIARFGIETALITLAPQASLTRALRLVAGRQIEAVVDCSGYAYGDGWGIERVRRRVAHYRRVRRAGGRIIMLPQAYGPFRDPEKRTACRQLFSLCDTVCARDAASLEHLRELGPRTEIVGPFPDITHGLEGIPPREPSVWANRVCIVPNARMLDRTADGVAGRYVDLLHLAVSSVRGRGLEPVLLLHEANDRPLAERIAARSPSDVPIIEDEARVTKGMIGASYAVIGSRYHALVGALSQAVPVLATSWSHKYDQLLDEYGCADSLLPSDAPDTVARERIRAFLDPERMASARRLLADRAGSQHAQVAALRRRLEPLILGQATARVREASGRSSFRTLEVLAAPVRRRLAAAGQARNLPKSESLREHCARTGVDPLRLEVIHKTATARNPLPINVPSRDLLPADPGWWGYSFHDVPRRRAGETLLATLPDCRVVSFRDRKGDYHPAILTRDRSAIRERELRFRPQHARALRQAEPPQRFGRATWITERVYHNHSHWLTAHLPKLILLRELGRLDDVLLPAARTPVMHESMRLLGLDPFSFTTFDERRVIAAGELTVVASDRFRPEMLRLVPAAFGVRRAPQPSRRIYISRERAARRRLLNESEVWPIFAAAGFEKVLMEDLSFARQVDLMRETAVLAAPHGAGLTNMLFCPEGAAVLEIADLGFPNPNFYALASALGHRYAIVDARSVGRGHPLEKHMRVSPGAVDAALGRCLEPAANSRRFSDRVQGAAQ